MFMLIPKGALNSNQGQSLLELVVAITIFAVASVAAIFLFFGGQALVVDTSNEAFALEYASEGLEAVRSIRNRDWEAVAAGTHGLVFSSGQWQFSESPDAKQSFTRSVVVTDLDVNTKKAVLTVSWPSDTRGDLSVVLTEELTQWDNPLFGGCDTGDLSGNWASPTTLGSADLGAGNEGTDIIAALPYVYISGKASSASKPDIFAFNVSNPSSPAATDDLNIGAGGINSLYLNPDNTNYVYGASANNAKEFVVVNVADPYNISEAAVLDLTGDDDALTINGVANTVYVGRSGGAANELVVIDVTTPSSPTIVRSLAVDADINDIFASTHTLYLVTSNDGNKKLKIYDIADPTNPVFLKDYSPSGSGKLLSVNIQLPGNVLVGDDGGKFFVLGATTTSQIYIRDSLNLGGAINDIMCVSDNYAYLATANSNKEFAVVSISNPDNISETASLNYPQVGTGIDFADNKVFMSVRSNDSLRVITSQ